DSAQTGEVEPLVVVAGLVLVGQERRALDVGGRLEDHEDLVSSLASLERAALEDPLDSITAGVDQRHLVAADLVAIPPVDPLLLLHDGESLVLCGSRRR